MANFQIGRESDDEFEDETLSYFQQIFGNGGKRGFNSENLEFSHRNLIDDVKMEYFVSYVDKAICDRRRDSDLRGLTLAFKNHDPIFDSHVDGWVKFAALKNANALSLQIDPPCPAGKSSYPHAYTLPGVMYSCSSWEDIRLHGCMLTLKMEFEWPSLSHLCLVDMVVDQTLVGKILQNCPLLSQLVLTRCRGLTSLSVNSKRLRKLHVEEDSSSTGLQISAPYISYLRITVKFRLPDANGRRQLEIGNFSSVSTADIDFLDASDVLDTLSTSMHMVQKAYTETNSFFAKFAHVMDLTVRNQCFRVVSTLARMAGDQFQLPKLNVELLNVLLSSSSYEDGIHGILCILNAASELTVFDINGGTIKEILNFKPTVDYNLDANSLLKLKTVAINFFTFPNGEPLLTLAQILLKNAKSLEDLCIYTGLGDDYKQDITKIMLKLLYNPRSSTQAKIHFRS